MKKTVEKSKQTVWLLSMLTVMVVLSVYYLVSDPLIPTNINEEVQNEDNTDIEVVTEETSDVQDLTDEIGINQNDLFIGLKMERNNERSKQIDQYYTMMNADLSEEAIAKIQAKIENLQTVEESEFILEKLLIADGYQDAVVLTNENSVDVVIQTKHLTNEEAVKIIKMVSERLGVPAVNVHIKTIK